MKYIDIYTNMLLISYSVYNIHFFGISNPSLRTFFNPNFGRKYSILSIYFYLPKFTKL